MIAILGCIIIVVILVWVTRSKKEYYLVRGQKSYEKHCANCHGKNGEGLKLLIPPLTDPTWVNNDSIICIIRNGLEGNIQVNGKSYNSRMTGNAQIEPDEISDLVSYIRHSFTHQPGRLTIQQVGEQVLKCK